MRHPRTVDWQIVPWDGDEFFDVGVQWLLDVHREAIKRAKLNGQAEAFAISTLTAYEVNPLCSLYGLIVESKPAGVIGVLNQDRFTRSAELTVFMSPEWRKKGLARIVLENVISILDDAGFLSLKVFPMSKASENMAHRLGFVEKHVDLKMMVREANNAD